MKPAILLVCLFSAKFAIAQTSIKGRVVEKGTDTPVPYATIGLMKKNVGINANEKGVFSLNLKDNLNYDTIIVSSVGYETVKLPVSNSSQSYQIELGKKFVKLGEVMVKEKWKTAALNEWGNCGLSTLVSSGYQTQAAQQLDSPVEGSYLSSVKYCTGAFFLGRSEYVFRLRVYDIDSLTNGPGNDLYNGIIEFRSRKRTDKVDVSDHNIRIPGRKFFVAVEWIYIPENAREYSTKDDMVYGPGVAMLKEDGSDKVWMLTHNGQWKKMLRTERIAISATVRY